MENGADMHTKRDHGKKKKFAGDDSLQRLSFLRVEDRDREIARMATTAFRENLSKLEESS